MQSYPDSISNTKSSFANYIFLINTFTYKIPVTDLDEITIPSLVNIGYLKLRFNFYFIAKPLHGFSSVFTSFYGSYVDFLGKTVTYLNKSIMSFL